MGKIFKTPDILTNFLCYIRTNILNKRANMLKKWFLNPYCVKNMLKSDAHTQVYYENCVYKIKV